MKYKMHLTYGIAAALALSLAGCADAGQEPTLAAEPSTSSAPVIETQTESTVLSSQFWEDVVELVNPAGDTTTAYKLEDGRYLDRCDRFFTYDGVENWTCEDGSIWNKKADSALASTNVYAEFAIERFLAQRPDHILFSDGSQNSSKIVLTFDTPITNFCVLQLQGSFDSDGVFHCAQMQELYRRDEITPEELMVVETNLEGLLPTRGISFVDAGGNTRYYFLAQSGEDNVPLLVSFK